MVTITIRGLSADTHQALKACAKKYGGGVAVEVRAILEDAVWPRDPTKLGSELAAIGKKYSIVDFNIERDETPARIISFD